MLFYPTWHGKLIITRDVLFTPAVRHIYSRQNHFDAEKHDHDAKAGDDNKASSGEEMWEDWRSERAVSNVYLYKSNDWGKKQTVPMFK